MHLKFHSPGLRGLILNLIAFHQSNPSQLTTNDGMSFPTTVNPFEEKEKRLLCNTLETVVSLIGGWFVRVGTLKFLHVLFRTQRRGIYVVLWVNEKLHFLPEFPNLKLYEPSVNGNDKWNIKSSLVHCDEVTVNSSM